MKFLVSHALLLTAMLLCVVAQASPSAADRTAAEALFQQAQALMEQGKADEACPKFEESQRLDPGVGTLLYLADCYENIGRTASAWGTFVEASYAANAAGQLDRQQLAEENAARLQPTLATLLLLVEAPNTPGLEITSDGQVLAAATWGTSMPIDPGPHTLQASAPGKAVWTTTIDVPHGPTATQVQVPPLASLPPPTPTPPVAASSPVPPQPASPPPPPPAENQDAGLGSQQTWGWVALIGGGASLAGGGLFTLLAVLDDGRADDQCRRDDPAVCNRRGVELSDSAATKANVATVLAGLGGALAITGGVLILTAPDESSSGQLRAGAGFAGADPAFWLEGSW